VALAIRTERRVVEPVEPPPRPSRWRWGYVAEGSRDLRFDLIRGLCVVGMICNHVGENSWARIFSLNEGVLITPAEGFVFISGYIFGMVYRSYIERKGLAAAVEKGLGRAWQIYKLTVVLSLLAIVPLVLQGVPEGLGEVNSWPELVAGILTLHHAVVMVDVLLMYTLLIAFAAGGLWFLTHGRWPWLVGVSFAVWLAFQIAPDWANNLPWYVEHNDMFHIAPWQFPFLVALTLGYHHVPFTAWLRRWTPITFAASAAIFGVLVWLVVARWDDYAWLGPLSYKPAEGPLRLLACLFVFQLARLLVTYFWKPIYGATGWLLMPLGQSSLYAYTMHLVVFFGLLAAITPYLDSEAFNTGLQLGTVAFVWLLTKKKVLFNIVPR
jgi:hypothetical protein